MPAEHEQQHEEAERRSATATCQPAGPTPSTERASGNWLASATPADEPNQIIEPPKPTA